MTTRNKHHIGSPKDTDKLAKENNSSLLPLVRLLARATATEFVAEATASSFQSHQPSKGKSND